MFDKAHFRLEGEIPNSVIQDVVFSNSLSKFGVNDNGYDNTLVIRKEGEHLITIKREPRRPNLWPTYIELNPSRFNTFNNMCTFLTSLNIDLHSCELRRIDHTADMIIPMERVLNTLIVKKKKKRTEFEEGDDISGLYFGKNNEVIAIYNKSKERSLKKPRALKLPKDFTRFEVRQKQNKIKYTKIHNLHRYKEENPFRNLQFYEVPYLDFEYEGLTLKERIFIESLDERGLHSVYKVLNRNNNFKRDYAKSLVISNYNEQIVKKYHEGLDNFFKEENAYE